MLKNKYQRLKAEKEAIEKELQKYKAEPVHPETDNNRKA